MNFIIMFASSTPSMFFISVSSLSKISSIFNLSYLYTVVSGIKIANVFFISGKEEKAKYMPLTNDLYIK